jgi:hypothetical protein
VAEAPIVVAMSESSQTSTVSISTVSPMPTDDEVVAILAGAEALWPTPTAVVDTAPSRHTTWRFSGRWWSRPVPARRDRPFR